MDSSINEIRQWAKSELCRCADFWICNGLDSENGGMYTCLDKRGEIYSTDKSVWMQGRTAWTYSKLYELHGGKPEWLKTAKSCLDFIEKYCINKDSSGRMYFQVTGDGKPLRQRRYCFSEAFYTLACAQYYKVTDDKRYIEIARDYYELIYNLNNGLIKDPTGLGEKGISRTRSGRSLADPMIYLNLSCVMMETDGVNKDIYVKRGKECIDRIVGYHYKEDLNCTLENVGINGEFWDDVTVGRTVNPGHVIECAWFMMEFANQTDDTAIHETAQKMLLDSIAIGWDKEYGGLLYFTDCLGKPPEAYEHDMKLWWPHNEMLISCAMAYKDTKKEIYLEWLERCVEYCKTYFVENEYGEWYGYLHRDGSPSEPSTKGSTFKGPFHLPRALMMMEQLLEGVE